MGVSALLLGLWSIVGTGLHLWLELGGTCLLNLIHPNYLSS